MSTQLILYPQNYKGRTSFTWTPNQFLVNAHFFTDLNNADAITNSGLITDILTAQPPTIVNTWYRTRASTDIAYPTTNNYLLIFDAVATGLHSSGIYQRLSNLIVGQVYSVTVNLVANASGHSMILIRNGVTYNSVSSTSASVNTTQITSSFTAQTVSDIFMFFVYDATDNSIVINTISITQNSMAPSGTFTDLEDGQVICDLYSEEDIPLTLSIDDFKNVAEKVQSYSKDFDLPATKRNNQIFNNLFEITRADDGLIFNPYVRTQCVLKQDGFILFEGYLRLINIKDKEGEISYNVNLYSEVIALADILKDSTFSELDLSELSSDYDITNIKASWDGYLVLENALTDPNEFAGPVGANTTDVMKYPFIDWNHQFFLDNNFNPSLPNLNSAFRPCIQVKYLINKIFAAAGFSWTSNFFDTSIATGGAFDFDKLYMDFNWGGDENPTDIDTNSWGKSAPSQQGNNFATLLGAPAKLTLEHFPPQQGYSLGSGVFTIPVGQDDTTLTIRFSFNFIFLNYDNKATLNLGWLVTPASGAPPYYMDQDLPASLEGSAVAYADVAGGNQNEISSITLDNPLTGGYYNDPPAITLITQGGGSGGSGFTGTANGTFPGTVTSITVDSAGSGYNWFNPPFVSFNGSTKSGVVHPYSGQFTTLPLEAGDTVELEMKSDIAGAVLQEMRSSGYNNMYIDWSATLNVWGTVNTMVAATLLNALRGELGQWDFLKGIMTMFNLVTMVDETNKKNILIEPYSDIFIKNTNSGNQTVLTLASRSIEHDWTDKIDVSQMELKPLTDLNKNTIFKFVEDDDDYCFNAYKIATSGGLYGSKLIDATTSTNGLPTVLSGEEEIIAEPFAATVMKPLDSMFPDFIVPSIYSVDDSNVSEGFDNSPRFLYDNGIQTLTTCSYNIPAQNGAGGITGADEFLQFSHLSTIPIASATQDFNFESQQLIQPLDAQGMPSDNLFSIYWQPYFNELYNADTRIMTLKVNLSPADINTFKFYDTVFIKNRSFRVNKIQYKPNSLATVEFILIP